jgi:hypothetical protein
LKRFKRREIIYPKYDRNECAELPRCESHAAPGVIGRNLTPHPDPVQPEPWRQNISGLSEASLRLLDILSEKPLARA